MAYEYLQRTPTSTGNQKVCTISAWVKNNTFSTGGHTIFSSGRTTTSPSDIRNQIDLVWNSNGTLQFEQYGFQSAGSFLSNFYARNLNKLYRDQSGWAHVLIQYDSTLASPQDRAKLFVNGIREDIETTSNNFALNYNLPIGVLTDNVGIRIGRGVGALQYGNSYWKGEICDYFFIDGQSIGPEVFGFYKDGKGYISAGTSQATDFRNGQWVPRTPREIKNLINDNGGFGVNGFYLPMNDSSNFGADFHCEPNSIIKLKGENLPQPRNGAPETTNAYVSQLREDPYAANLVLAVPGISTYRGPELVSEGTFNTGSTGSWTISRSATLTVVDGKLRVTNTSLSTSGAHLPITCEIGKVYNFSFEIGPIGANFGYVGISDNDTYATGTFSYYYNALSNGFYSVTFKANATTQYIHLHVYGGSTGDFKDFDNISVREVNEPTDYSANIKGSGNNKTLIGNGGAGIAAIPSYYGSALSFDGSGDYLQSSYISDWDLGNGDFTIECWVKTTDTATNYPSIVGRWQSAGNACWDFRPQSTDASDNFSFIYSTDGTAATLVNSGINICTGDFYHLVAERNGTNITLYVNGVATVVHSIGTSTIFNTSNVPLYIGYDPYGSSYYNGYIQDLRIYKGVAKYKSGFDVPKPYTPVGISTWRAVPDTTANNFATLNPLEQTNGSTTLTFSEGNTRIVFGGTGYNTVYSTVGVTTGKYYFECRYNTEYVSPGIGVNNTYPIIRVDNGNIYHNDVLVETPSPQQPQAVGQIYGIALDRTNSSVQFYLNGSAYSASHSFSASDKEVFAHIMSQTATQSSDSSWNFGQNPSFGGRETAGTFTDSNGKGLFKYQPPEGFLALCSDNLPRPSISDPGEYFKTVLYTGDGSSRAVTGVGFQPDLVWIKPRNFADNHVIYDSVRGPFIGLYSNATSAEFSSGNGLTSFDSDGFSTNSFNNINDTGDQFVAWCWKAGGKAVTNTDGSIISRVSVNQDAGFSIVSYKGTGANATVGHGLGKTPKLIIVKNRDSVTEWPVLETMVNGGTHYLRLDGTSASTITSVVWNNTNPTSEVFSVGTYEYANENTKNHIAYCWAEVEGFSKFGSYVGNGSADGPFVYCGFKPAWVMYKRTDTTGDWAILDSSRQSTNPLNLRLFANNTNVDTTGVTSFDFLSNGFKIRDSAGSINASGGTYIFAAFAEAPFPYANAK